VAVVALSIGVRFPPTERAAAGVTMGEMFRELLNPLFIVLFASMFLTAASELAPGQWVDFALSRTVHMPGILLLVYVSALMFVIAPLRRPARSQTVANRPPVVLVPDGIAWSGGAQRRELAVNGRSRRDGLGTGVCYMWPTMLATASERFPRGGALLMGLMGTAGTLSIRFVLPLMGAIYDNKKIEIAGGERVQRAAAGIRARTRARHRGPDLIPRRRHLRLFCYSFSVRSGFTTDQKRVTKENRPTARSRVSPAMSLVW